MSNGLRVIAISGDWHGAGKTTAAIELQRRIPNSEIISLATPIKEFAHSLGWKGIKDKKGRRLLQLLGTECGRKCIREAIWVDKWLEAALASGKSTIICDDLRFQSEYQFLKQYADCTFIHVHKKVNPFVALWRHLTAHESERGIKFDRALSHPHYTIFNNYKTVEDFKNHIKNISGVL